MDQFHLAEVDQFWLAPKVIVSAQVEFDEKEFTMEEAEQFVKSALSAQDKSTLAAMQIDPIQAEMNRKIGVSPEVFAKYNPARPGDKKPFQL